MSGDAAPGGFDERPPDHGGKRLEGKTHRHRTGAMRMIRPTKSETPTRAARSRERVPRKPCR
jgi:hypothetical protein